MDHSLYAGKQDAAFASLRLKHTIGSRRGCAARAEVRVSTHSPSISLSLSLAYSSGVGSVCRLAGAHRKLHSRHSTRGATCFRLGRPSKAIISLRWPFARPTDYTCMQQQPSRHPRSDESSPQRPDPSRQKSSKDESMGSVTVSGSVMGKRGIRRACQH